MAQAVFQHSQSYTSSKTNTFLVKVQNKQNKNGAVGRLPEFQKTDNLLVGSQITLVVLHAEKLVSSGTDHFRYRPADR